MSSAILRHIDGGDLAEALVSGIYRVVSSQEYLNSINVFPVADSDTGTNLSLSLSAALPVLLQEEQRHLGTMLAALADALLDSARGNSGAILAQFFQGVSDSAGETTRFTPYTLAKALMTGSEYARDALSEPREGTILSAISAYAHSVSQQVAAAEKSDFRDVLRRARRIVDEAVLDTPNQLEVLDKAGVVDAGAKGFAELVAGMTDVLLDGRSTSKPENITFESVPVVFDSADNDSEYRYCTECLVVGDDIDRRKLREALSDLGDSLVLAGSKRKAKIHVHVDDPDTVFTVARKFGEITGQKADDMHRQQSATHGKSGSFAVITDSGADIPDEDLERLDIHMVPCRIQFGDRGYLDKVSITTGEFYQQLETNPHHPTTSQPSPGDYRRHFQFLKSHFADVLSINLTAAASGTFEGARSAAERTGAAERIQVIDSRNASVGQGSLVVLAAECARAGLTIDRTASIIEREIPRTRTFAILRNLRFAVRGGRLPGWVGVISNALRLTPVIGFRRNGTIGLKACLLGRRRAVNRFARFIAKLVGSEPVQLGIGHAMCADDANELRNTLVNLVPGATQIDICNLGTAVGVHGGPGSLVVSFRPTVSAVDLAVGDD